MWPDPRRVNRAGGQKIAGERKTSRITKETSEFAVFRVKTQCEKTDEGREAPGEAIILYIPGDRQENLRDDLYVPPAVDAYAGGYRRCRKGE
jgi:hypothetical protein